ncbi:hypothetical protein SLEP1_g28236 [Rubroshorea leprosula]|uniref:RNA-directed DNA polymerase n=1 Tax=Rubroshorea leprosula TaxID=152421 RepID=A0AAV5K4G7_9ROSI|nr:hypothetical protein SLEP1_g28236 [Rubroshorea leprosula]
MSAPRGYKYPPTTSDEGVEAAEDFNSVRLRSCPNIWRRGRPPRNEVDEQEDTQLSEPGLNDFRPMPRNLFVGGAKQDHLSETDDDERTPTGSTEPARTTELEERTRILEMAMGKILARLIPDDPLIPLLNRDAQPATVVATRNSPALSNVMVPTRPRGSGKLNNEPSSSKHSEELMRKNADLERQLRYVQKSIDELKSPRSHQQTLDLDNAPLNLSITAEPYQEGFKIPHLETYDGSGDPDEHLYTYQAIMRIQNANDAMMCKVFPATLKSTARRWYHKLPRHSIDSYSQLAKLFSNKFASKREIKCTATELMQVNQKEGESLRDYMQRFNKATLDIDNVPDTICLSALLHGLKRGRFLDDLLENPPRTWNEVNDRSISFILSKDFQSSKRRADDKQSKSQEQPLRREEKKKQKVSEQWGKPADFPKYANYIPLTLPRSQILAQIQNWVRRPPPPLYESPRADKSKHCDYHRTYGHNTEDCQHLNDELEFLACNGKLEGYVQKPHAQQPTQTHFVQGYDRPQGQRYQLDGAQDAYQDNPYPSEQGRAYRGRPFNRRGQGQRAAVQNQKDKKGVGYAGIPPPSGTINMISCGVHSGGQSAGARKAYARQVMTVNKNKPLKRPFEEAEWENTPITFSPADYKRAEGEPDIMMPHADPFVATVHIGNHNVNKVFIDTGSSLDILYWSCFQKMQLNPDSLQKYEGPIYGFDNQPVPVEGVITLPIYVGSEPRFRMASVTFLVVKMESAFNAILGRATLCELKAVISQPHLCMKFPTPQGVGVLKGNQKMAIACYQDTFKKVELAAAPACAEGRKPTQLGQQTMRHVCVDYGRNARHSDGVDRPQAQHGPHQKASGFIRRVEYSEWVSNPVLVKKPNGKWRMCIDFTNLNDACPKDPHPLPNVEKNIEVYVDDMIVTSVRAEDHIDDLDETFQNLRRAQIKMNPLKCTFAVESGKFLGYVVSKKGIEVNPEKVQAVQQMEPPKTREGAGRSADGTPQDSKRCTASDRSGGCVAEVYSQIGRKAFDELKQYLASTPLLSKPVDGECLYLYLGVTEEAMSSVLLREENKNQKPICYVSKVLQGAEQNYPLAEKAVFALVYTARKLKAYFQSHQIVVYTDLRLRKILQKPELFGRLIGWSIELSEYDLKFQPRTTIKGQAIADFLVECISVTEGDKAPDYPAWVLYVDGAANIEGSGARAVLIGPDGFKSEHALRFKFQTTNNAAEYEALIYGLKLASELKVQSIRVFSDSQLVRSTIVEVLDAPSYTDFTVECQLLSTDPSTPSWTTPLMNYLQSGELPEDPSTAKSIKRRAAHFTLLDNQLYKRATSMPLLRCLTSYEAEYAVREVHEGVCGMHIGGKTLARKLLRHGYYWPTMVEDAQNYVKNVRLASSMLMIYTCQARCYHLSRFPGPLLNGASTCSALSSRAKEAAISWFSIPKRIIADNGPQFRAAALRSFCNDYGIELALTSVYTPQSNGQAEFANKIVLRGLKTRVLATHTNWVEKLNKVLWSCRTTPSSATGETPFSLAYGAEAIIPVEVGLPSDRLDRHDDQNNEQLLRENLDLVEEIREMSRISNMAHQSRVAKFYNKRVRARQFQVDDLVLRKAGLTNTYSHMGKLAPNWEGPYMVVQVKRPGSYVLADIQGHQLPYIWNIQNLRKFYS